MKFERIALIARVEAEIERRKLNARLHAEEADEQAQKMRAEHVEATSAAWLEFIRIVRRRVAKGEPVGLDDAPRELIEPLRGGLRLWKEPKFATAQANTGKLEALLGLLRSSPDEHVTTAGLAAAGFSLQELTR